MVKSTYWVTEPVTHNRALQPVGTPLELTPRQAANWLAAGKLSETEPAKSVQTKTRKQPISEDKS